MKKATFNLLCLLAGVVVAVAAGCAPLAPAEPVTIQPPAAEPAATANGAIDWMPLDGVLAATVTNRHRVRYLEISLPPHWTALQALYARVARTGPQTSPADYPTRESKLAYYINAHNLLALVAIAPHFGAGKVDPHTVSEVGSPETHFIFLLDGQAVTLAAIRDTLLAPLAGDDPRPLLALCAGRSNDPPLRQTAYRPETLDAELDDQLRLTLRQSPWTEIGFARRELQVPPAVNAYRAFFWQRYPHVSPEARAEVEFQSVLMNFTDHRGRKWIARSVGFDVVPLEPADTFNNEPFLRSVHR